MPKMWDMNCGDIASCFFLKFFLFLLGGVGWGGGGDTEFIWQRHELVGGQLVHPTKH